MMRMVLTSVLMLLVLTSTAFSQFVFDLTGTGARAEGMGNAFIAVSDDASAASWNPAGLVAHEKLLMGFDYDSYSADNQYNDGLSLFNKNQNFNSVSQFSMIAPVRFRGRAMVFGFSYGRVFQEYWNSGTSGTGTHYNQALGIERDSSELIYSSVSAEHPNLKALNLALGTKLTPTVSVGAAINIYSGQNVGVGLIDTVIPHFTNDQLGGDQYVYHQKTIEIIDTLKYSGVNFTLGAKFEGGLVDFGIIVRTPFDLRSESDMKINFRTVENGLLQNVGSDTVYIDDQLVKISIPWVIGFGGAMHPSEVLTIAADFEYRGFSGQQVKVRDSIYIRPGSENEEFYTIFDLDQFNTSAFRFGVEYLWHSPWESFPVIPIRAGFSSVSVPTNLISKDIEGVGYPGWDQSIQTKFHIGLGVKWSQIYLDAAFTHSTLDMPFDSFAAGWENTSDSFVFGFTGYF